MSFLSIELKGLKELQDYYKTLDKQSKEVIKAEFIFAGAKIQARMQKDAPVDTSRLKNAIKYKLISATELEFVDPVFYAPYMEFGTGDKFSADAAVVSYAATFLSKNSKKNYNVRSKKINKRSKSGKPEKIATTTNTEIKRPGIAPRPFFFRNRSGQRRITEILNIIKENITSGLKSIS